MFANSIINFVVLDSTWEGSEAFHLDHSGKVHSWAKNDHLGFEIFYSDGGIVRRYRPDYLVRLNDGSFLIVEVKSVMDEKSAAKKEAAKQWVEAVVVLLEIASMFFL